jgi:hypothetical protein
MMGSLHPFLIAAASGSLLMGCATQTRESQTLTVSDCRTYFLEEASHPNTELFNHTIQAAVDGNDGALSTILSWRQMTDGEGALNYSAMLLDLRSTVGSARFDRAMKNLQPEEQARVQDSLNAASRIRHLTKKSGIQ